MLEEASMRAKINEVTLKKPDLTQQRMVMMATALQYSMWLESKNDEILELAKRLQPTT